jgi:hypothetical protein
MKDLDPEWMAQIDIDPFWVWNNVQPSEEVLGDIQLLLYWFDQGSINLDQLTDGLEEYEHHNDVRYSLMAMRHNPLVAEEEVVEEK